ncbi:MAG: CHASE2 domain-containing protein [Treponema sp.]|jgi:adenylate cyclase|nr:CHASE2 domain-containing protein [Treponema sp.]
MSAWKSALTGLAAAAFFSILYPIGLFGPLEERIYDMFLRFRQNRQRIGNVVFLDVDDAAIAYNGLFPWPRSVTANGLLRLKEYGPAAVIFDIEYIDRGPQGVDTVYLNQGLSADFNRSFQEINSYVLDLFSAVHTGRVSPGETKRFATELSQLILEEQNTLFARAQGIARDNDEYLAQASALFGKSWSTLNLRYDELTGEQAERRSMAEELFSYPVKAAPDAHTGAFVDILPALPSFSRAAQGAGFTNVFIDEDGVRRRIYLAQNIKDHWYLQLAFSPLITYLGKPEIELYPRKLIIRDAKIPGDGTETVKDIEIPLDTRGRMMLDWPPTDYLNSYTHISFADFSLLEECETQIGEYARALSSSGISFFAQFDSSLNDVPVLLYRTGENLDAAMELKAAALAEKSEEAFDEYVRLRRENRRLLRTLEDLEISTRMAELSLSVQAQNPENSQVIEEEANYIITLTDYIKLSLDQYEETEARIKNALENKFCILGRVDTGTTDMGVNPFWGEYVNVGTHAVVLDTILSESFITPLSPLWSILLTLIVVPLFFFLSFALTPALRTALGFAAALLIAAVSILLFRYSGIFLGPLGPVLAMVIAVIAREILSYAGSEREKRFYRKAFATYTSEAVADQIARNPELLQLGGSKRQMSAIFTDIRGFSTISERLSPEDLVRLLNKYLTVMSDAVLEELGTIDKYEGDAIIAFFGAPLEQPDHALRACISAINMKRIEAELNKTIIAENLSPAPLLTRFGINTGDMVAGNMGTEKKMNYTIMGDAVNLAARLEGVNKQYGTWILASDATIRETEGRILTRRLDKVRVVGKSEPVQLYEILETTDNAGPEQTEKVTAFHQALDLFEQREWQKAREGFRQILARTPGDGPSAIYIKRCDEYLINPPGDKWEGVFNLTEK